MEAIPTIESPRKYVKSEFLDSAFVELKSGDFFEISMKYPILEMKNAEEQCFVRREVCDMLFEAVRFLPKGYRLKIWDAWRPFSLQKEIYDAYSINIIKDFELERCTDEQRKVEIHKFVSEPVNNKDIPPVHTTGGAIDVTLIDSEGKELEMGTNFDAFTVKTDTSYFEREISEDKTIRDNRRLLYYVMTNVGFTNLPSEWWHFDYGDKFWGYYKRKPAIYRGVFTKEEMDEIWRRQFISETER